MPIFHNFPGGPEKHHKEDPCCVKRSSGPHLKRGLLDCRLVVLPSDCEVRSDVQGCS